MFLRRIWIVLLVAMASHVTFAQPAQQPRNVILFISDGCGPASITMARDFVRYTTGRETLAMDTVLVGSMRTYATNSRVTDSAAGATALACGVKTYNGAIAVDTLRQPVATLLEAAELRGMATGLVATSRITHATPASFAAHVPSRSMEAEIAAQMLEQGVDVVLGGGRSFFLPRATGGLRDDGRNLLEEAAAEGYQVVQSRSELDRIAKAPVLGLFDDSHMDYEIDRDSLDEPSLAEMTEKAIEMLDDDPDGFFLMIEASRIDHAAHGNDAAAHLHDVLAYERAVAVALAYAARDGETLVVATSDHETGGMTLGRNVNGIGIYDWKPDVLARVQASLPVMVEAIEAQTHTPCQALEAFAGITCTEEETAHVEQALEEGLLFVTMADIISRHALVGWTTLGHTAVDVNLYAFGPGQELFAGHHDNAEVGRRLATVLGFDLPALTRQLHRQPAASE